MNWQSIAIPLAGVAVAIVAWRNYGWLGVAFVVTGIVMWMLLHFTRMMKVLQRASNRPVGFCESAVMLNAKLRPGVNLLHVMAMTRALGELLSPKGEQPEIYRWSDAGGSCVTCEFAQGKLAKWELMRPAPEVEQGNPAAP
jgi:Flp pilus assembly protein TadB